MQSHASVIGRASEKGASSTLKEVPPTKSGSVSNGDCSDVDLKKSPSVSLDLSNSDKEVIRLVGQHLCSLGLQKSCETLMSESGCHLEHSSASRFREHVMNGQWNKVEAILPEMKLLLKHQRHSQKVKFFVMEQKFLELLEDGKVIEALNCLRNQITPTRIFVNRVHQLSSFLMISSPEELQKAANWEGKGTNSRIKLLEKLQGYFPISVMMRPNRLNILLTQALTYQQSKCLFDNSTSLPNLSSYSLLVDHTSLRRNFPTTTQQILKDHRDDVLFCQFSHNGKMLATCSKDSSVIIWGVDPVTHHVKLLRSLTGHNYGVGYLQWSPCDTHIIACGSEESSEVWLWNAQTGELQSKLSNSSDDCLSCCCWSTDGKRYITAGNKGQFYMCDLDGNIIESWDGVRVQGLTALPDNKTVLASDTQHRIRAYNFDDMTDKNLIKEDHPIISFTQSTDGRLILLNVATQGVHMWDTQDKILLRKYQGVVHGFYTIRSCFGGAANQFIASGSEDNMVYIWHHSREKPIEALPGHTKTVNCVSWNKEVPGMLASVSDDCTIRIWGPQEYISDEDSDDETYPYSL